MPSKRMHLAFCLAALLNSAAFAQKTEVTVSRGKVKAEASSATVLVESGQRAVLTTQASPTVTADEPMVQDLVRMSQWVEAEKKAARLHLPHTSIQIHSLDNEKVVRYGCLSEVPNKGLQPSDTCRIGPTSMGTNDKFYDMQADLLTVERKELQRDEGYYYIHFLKPVPAGGAFQFIHVSESEPGGDFLWKEGKLWYWQQSNDTPESLNYFLQILPPSAIFVDSTLPAGPILAMNGRTAVTIRNYTGPQADGTVVIAFLWPDADGTTLADLPPQYRGLRDAAEEQLSREYHKTMESIRAGQAYNDLSTPVRTILTRNSALLRRDKNLLARAQYFLGQNPKHIDELFAGDGVADWQRQLIDEADFLGTPPWPKDPAEGYIHPVYVSRLGSLIREDTFALAYLGGHWTCLGNMGNRRMTDVAAFRTDVAKGEYAELAKRLSKISWDKAGPEALQLYKDFVDRNVPVADFWGELGVKLAGGGSFETALDAFTRCGNAQPDQMWQFTAMVWQGHMLDLQGQRDKAIACYNAALEVGGPHTMRHDQWGIVLNDVWVQARLKEPFTREMLQAPKPASLIAALQAVPWDGGGPEALKVYDAFVQQKQQDPQFWGILGIKLAGGTCWEQSLDAFARCENANPDSLWRFTSLVWQGHLLDLASQRNKALEKYNAGLQVDGAADIRMRHDQWKMVINQDWVKARLAEPFTAKMMGK